MGAGRGGGVCVCVCGGGGGGQEEDPKTPSSENLKGVCGTSLLQI